MDWIQKWNNKQAHAPYREAIVKDYEDAFWAEFAPHYDELHCWDYPRLAKEKLKPYLGGVSSVLEIGAGTGALTLELAPEVSKLTALDASPHMLRQLKPKIERTGMTNIRPLHTSWEDAAVEAHDMVIASGCAYGFFDIEAAILKMLALARKAIVFTGDLNRREPRALAELRKNFNWNIQNGLDEPLLYNVLYQMRLYPDVHVIRNLAQEFRFPDIQTTVDRLRIMLRLKPDRIPELASALEPFTDATTGEVHLGAGSFTGMVMVCPV